MLAQFRRLILAAFLWVACSVGAFSYFSRSQHRLNATDQSSVTVSEASFYQGKIQPIFTARCISCHSCNTAPCQLNLTSYDGVTRGANKIPNYQPLKQSPVPPTRLGIDAHSEEGWRSLKFFSVTQNENPRMTSLYEALDLKMKNPVAPVIAGAEVTRVCPANPDQWEKFAKSHSESGMPYGFPALSAQELGLIETWLKAGAPGPNADERRALTLPNNEAGRSVIARTEEFLNEPSLKARLISRYLYEHLFLAHLQFKSEMPGQFYRLIRSRTRCSDGVDEIASVRPYDDPGVAAESVTYCLRKVDQAITEKNHIVYEMGEPRLRRWREIFYEKPWSVSRLPSYGEKTSSNPFITFQELPAKARYQWLLDDAQYTINTFIKSVVCRGNTAVNVIDEQFYILFLDPSVDHFVNNPDYAAQASPSLRLPGYYGSNVKFLKLSTKIVPFLITKLKNRRNDYRRYRDVRYVADRPQGYSLNDLWDGDGTNPNAVLTVFRHFDSAQVLKGAWGPRPKTAWVLDYPLFERIVYNLVSGYDNYGTMGHQLLVRVYMHYIRMEAEENFLSFLPAENRIPLRNYWYREAPDMNKRYPLNPGTGVLSPSAVHYSVAAKAQGPAAWAQAKEELFKGLFQSRFKKEVLQTSDLINEVPLSGAVAPVITSVQEFEHELRKLVSRPASLLPFSKYLDDTALLHLVVDGERSDRVYTMIRNKEHFNIASILGERGRRDFENDSINVVPGFQASYPNRFFVVELKDAANFLSQLQKVHQQSDIRDLIGHYGISRQDPSFWRHYDWFVHFFAKHDPTEAGAIDLIRYGNAEPLPEDDENTEQ